MGVKFIWYECMTRRISELVLLIVGTLMLVGTTPLKVLYWPEGTEWYSPNKPARISQINFFRGSAGNGLLVRLVVNKYTWSVREGLTRVIESFDPHYLFFRPSTELITNRQFRGVIPLWLMPFALHNWLTMRQDRKIWCLLGLVTLTGLSILVEDHFFSPAKVPMLIAVYALAVWGGITLCKKLWLR